MNEDEDGALRVVLYGCYFLCLFLRKVIFWIFGCFCFIRIRVTYRFL